MKSLITKCQAPNNCHSRDTCHSRESGNLNESRIWMPASAGMTALACNLLFGILFFTATLASGAGGEEGSFAYSHHGKRDPFVPLVGAATTRTTTSLEDVIGIEDVSLQGLASDSAGRGAAILNGEMIREGQSVGHLTVKKISKDKVILIIDDEEYTLNLSDEGGNKKGAR